MIKFTKWVNLSILGMALAIAMYFVSYNPDYAFLRIWAYVAFPLTLVSLVLMIIRDIRNPK